MLLKIVLLCLILRFSYSTEKSSKSGEKEVFQATHEWKEIKEGQKVPAGLHYRINLSTGKKEAKINEDDDQKTVKHGFSLVSKEKEDNQQQFLGSTNVKSKDTIDITEEDSKKVKTRYRSIKELKKELGDINLNPKTDAEIINELFLEYDEVTRKREPDKKRISSILKDLIYLSHQIDNAIEFVRLDGFQKIIYKNLNSTDDNVIQETLKLFSSLVQNNSKVKVHALETGSISKLLKILNLNSSPKVQHSTLVALSCFLRTFPFAQNSFIELGGVNIFSELFGSSNTKLKLKIVTLIDDLLTERKNDGKNFEGHKQIDLKEILHELDWCEHLNTLISEVSIIDINDHDSIEKCLTAMNSLKEKCGDVYSKDILVNLSNRYEVLTNNTKDIDFKEFYSSLGDLSLSLVLNKTSFTHNIKQEL